MCNNYQCNEGDKLSKEERERERVQMHPIYINGCEKIKNGRACVVNYHVRGHETSHDFIELKVKTIKINV